MGGSQVLVVGAESPLVIALQQRVKRLEALVQAVDTLRARIPSSADGIWSGPAHTVYAVALDTLGGELAAAGARLHDALSQSRHALATLVPNG